jgi:two-component system response regulator protein BraR/BceR
MVNILIVEDDAVIARALAGHLRKWGFEACCAEDLSDIMPLFVKTAPQLVLLDIALPFYSGFYWCAKIREISKVPVIFISSAADNMMTRLLAALNLVNIPLTLLCTAGTVAVYALVYAAVYALTARTYYRIVK